MNMNAFGGALLIVIRGGVLAGTGAPLAVRWYMSGSVLDQHSFAPF